MSIELSDRVLGALLLATVALVAYGWLALIARIADRAAS